MIRTASLVFACLASAMLAIGADISKDPATMATMAAGVTVTLLTC